MKTADNPIVIIPSAAKTSLMKKKRDLASEKIAQLAGSKESLCHLQMEVAELEKERVKNAIKNDNELQELERERVKNSIGYERERHEMQMRMLEAELKRKENSL